MKIRLAGWESQGLRCPDVKLSLVDGTNVPRVVLLQMPNGTGKTTTLNLILAAMTGSARLWDAQQVRSLQRARATNASGTFTLRLLVDSTPLVFEMHFDFLEGVAVYRTSSPSLGGVEDGWVCPPSVRRFLKESFAELFVFDGEFAHRLLDARQAEAERAIDALCQIDLLDRVAAVAESDWERASRGQGAKTAQGLSMYRNREEALQVREKELTKALKKLKKRNDELGEDVEKLESSIESRMAESKRYREQFEELHSRVANAKSRLSGVALQLMSGIRRPHLLDERLGKALIVFRNSLDRAQLPESSSRQFFLELADEPTCVCGRPIGESEKAQILGQAAKYLGDDLAGVINAIKSDIGQHLGDQRSVDQEQHSAAVASLAEASDEYHLASTELAALRASVLSESDENELRNIQAEISHKTSERQENEDHIAEIERSARPTDDETTHCLAAIHKQLRDVRDKIAEVSNTVRMRQQTVAIQQLAAKAKEIARDRLRKVLRDECNRRLKRILAGDPIQIKRIGQSLELEAQQGASVGQTLAVGYTFLTSVLHRGTHDFPLIVDSPAGPLDDLVRREVGAMIPELCQQFTAFMISSERPYFLAALESKAGKGIRYLTLFRKTPGTQPLLRSLPKKGVSQTDNAVVVEGRDYFNTFELVAEPEED